MKEIENGLTFLVALFGILMIIFIASFKFTSKYNDTFACLALICAVIGIGTVAALIYVRGSNDNNNLVT